MATYSVGSRGPIVEAIQETLNLSVFKKLEPLVVDGKFGSKTKEMVEAFQTENPPLVVDGIVGSNTEAILGRYRQFWLERGARELPVADVTVGQLHASDDCGYFSAYILAQYVGNNGNLGGLTFSRDDVFQLRDSFANINPKHHGKEQVGTETLYLRSTVAPKFLEFLGRPGYRFETVTGPTIGAMKNEEFISLMRDVTSDGRTGSMIAAPNFSGAGGPGHWFVALDMKMVRNKVYILLYESSGRISRQLRSKKMPAGSYLGWVAAHNLRLVLEQAMLGIECGFARK